MDFLFLLRCLSQKPFWQRSFSRSPTRRSSMWPERRTAKPLEVCSCFFHFYLIYTCHQDICCSNLKRIQYVHNNLVHSVRPCKVGRLSGKLWSMSEIQPFSANASEAEHRAFHKQYFWFTVLKVLLKDSMIRVNDVWALNLTSIHVLDARHFLHWRDCISTDWFFPLVRLFDLDCVTEFCLLTLSLFSIFIYLFFIYFVFVISVLSFSPMAALVNSYLWPPLFSSDSLEKMALCFNMLFLLLMWIKAPAKQLAQSSALASLTGLSEYPFFCHRGAGWRIYIN